MPAAAIPGEGAEAAAAPPPQTERPPYSYAALIATAIQESPEQRLPVRGIYRAIAQRFPYYYRLGQKGWQNSVRHNLSLHACFQKVPRQGGAGAEGGRGGAWRLDPACQGTFEEGDSRRRRRVRRAQPQPPPAAAPHLQPPPYYLPASPQPSPPAAAPACLPPPGQPSPYPLCSGGSSSGIPVGLGSLGGYGAHSPFLMPGGVGATASWSPPAAAAASFPQPPDVLLVPWWNWAQPQEPARPRPPF